MGVYIVWFLLCISGIGLAILSLISGNQKLPKIQLICVGIGSLLLLATIGLSVYDVRTKSAVDTYFAAMQLLPLLAFGWIVFNSYRQWRRHSR